MLGQTNRARGATQHKSPERPSTMIRLRSAEGRSEAEGAATEIASRSPRHQSTRSPASKILSRPSHRGNHPNPNKTKRILHPKSLHINSTQLATIEIEDRNEELRTFPRLLSFSPPQTTDSKDFSNKISEISNLQPNFPQTVHSRYFTGKISGIKILQPPPLCNPNKTKTRRKTEGEGGGGRLP